MTITFESLSARLSAISAAESVTRVELGLLSREVLAFVVETKDIRIVNTLLGKNEAGKYVLTSQNRKAAGFYFSHFMPFSTNEAKVSEGQLLQFVKMKAKAWDKYAIIIEQWLSDEANNLWTWADANIKMEAKPANYAGKFTKLVEKALADEVDGINGADILAAVLAGGVSVNDLMSVVEQMSKEAA